jgi:hypothetical protein
MNHVDPTARLLRAAKLAEQQLEAERDQVEANIRDGIQSATYERMMEIHTACARLSHSHKPEIKLMAQFACYGIDVAIRTYGTIERKE